MYAWDLNLSVAADEQNIIIGNFHDQTRASHKYKADFNDNNYSDVKLSTAQLEKSLQTLATCACYYV